MSSIEPKPEFLTRVKRGEGHALRLTFCNVQKVAPFQCGVHGAFTVKQRSEDGRPLRYRLTFEARHVEGSRRLHICRPRGGSKPAAVRLTDQWQSCTAEVECSHEYEVHGLLFTLVDRSHPAHGVCELDNITVRRIGPDRRPAGGNLVKNGTFEENADGWSGHALVWREVKSP